VPDVNAGSDEEPDLPAAAAASAASGPHGSAAPVAAGQGKGAQQAVRSEAEAQQAAMCSPFAKGRAALRIAAAQALGAQGWSDLVSKLEQTFERVSCIRLTMLLDMVQSVSGVVPLAAATTHSRVLDWAAFPGQPSHAHALHLPCAHLLCCTPYGASDVPMCTCM
jgi:hypothetical protein